MKKNLKVTVNGRTYDVVVEETGSVVSVSESEVVQKFEEKKEEIKEKSQDQGSEKIEAPMPGIIVSVNVSSGQKIKKGDVLVVLEAMKMENEIMSPRDGEVMSVNVNKGDSVDSGTLLVSLV